MNAKTQALFLTFRMALEHWSKHIGHRDAYVRGSLARKYIADQFICYRRLVGRDVFLNKIRDDVAKGRLVAF